MRISVEASLRKLRTSYIDILYVHWWDWETSIEEVMNGLHMLVQQGLVLYLVRSNYIFGSSDYFDSVWLLGCISDTPAWMVSQANQYARDHSKTPFVIYQGLWNVIDRSLERDIIPMCKAHGLSRLLSLLVMFSVADRHGHRPVECVSRRKASH